MNFEIVKKSARTKARAGRLHTAHGVIETPAFMAVGTQGAVKSMNTEMLSQIGCQIILSNTYHLALRPGSQLIRKMGGLHRFMNWEKPILTDSGGYQVFSLESRRKISEEGVIFQSHLDGSKHVFTPENVIDFQRDFGSDIMMPLDICTAYPADPRSVKKDLAITHQWEARAKAYWETAPGKQMLFGIVQGGMEKSLREESIAAVTQIEFPGYAIGGVSVGEPTEKMEEMIAFCAERLPENAPRYVMGIGLPENLEFAVAHGVDMFDCVLPTRLARHGHLLTSEGKLNIRNAQFAEDERPLDAKCQCSTCRHYSRAYLRHLFVAKEITAMILMSFHNVWFLVKFVEDLRRAVLAE